MKGRPSQVSSDASSEQSTRASTPARRASSSGVVQRTSRNSMPGASGGPGAQTAPRRKSDVPPITQEGSEPSPPPSEERVSSKTSKRHSVGLPPESQSDLALAGPPSFSVGDRCLVGQAQAIGTVRFVGPTEFASGIWFGLELEEPYGKNDGTVKGVRYFECKQQHGIFCRQSALSPVAEPGQHEAKQAAPSAHVATDLTQGTTEMHMMPVPVASASKERKKTAPTPQEAKDEPSASPAQGSAQAKRGTKESAALEVGMMPSAGKPHSTLQRELAQAVEDHDVPRIRAMLHKAVGSNISPKELENAQSILNFELNRSLFKEIEDIRAVVSGLQGTVRAITSTVGPNSAALIAKPAAQDLAGSGGGKSIGRADELGTSTQTLAGMIERSSEEIATRIEQHQWEVASYLENTIMRATTGMWQAVRRGMHGSHDPSSSPAPISPPARQLRSLPSKAHTREAAEPDAEEEALEADAFDSGEDFPASVKVTPVQNAPRRAIHLSKTVSQSWRQDEDEDEDEEEDQKNQELSRGDALRDIQQHAVHRALEAQETKVLGGIAAVQAPKRTGEDASGRASVEDRALQYLTEKASQNSSVTRLEDAPLQEDKLGQEMPRRAARSSIRHEDAQLCEAAARLIQARWRVVLACRQQHLEEARIGLRKPSSLGINNKQQSSKSAAQFRLEEDMSSVGSTATPELSLDPGRIPPTKYKHRSRPDLSGDWIFNFEGMTHSWNINGTKALTPDDTEEYDILVENGKETLAGWYLIGKSDDGHVLVWEDGQSLERIVWCRCGHEAKLQGAFDDDDEDGEEESFSVHMVDGASGELLLKLEATRTWLVDDLMDGVSHELGIPASDQQLLYQQRPLHRKDEPLIDMLPVTSEEPVILTLFRSERPHRSAWLRDIGEAATDFSKVAQTAQNLDLVARRSAHDAVLAAVRADPDALRHAPEEMQCDRDIVLNAVRDGGASLFSLRSQFQADREIVLAAVQKDGMSLRHASAELQADREVVCNAVLQDGQARRYAADALQEDPQVLRAAAGQDAEAWAAGSPRQSPREGLEATREGEQQQTAQSVPKLPPTNRLQVPAGAALASGSAASSMGSSPRQLTPREIIEQQNEEYRESELVDQKREADAHLAEIAVEMTHRERELEEAEDALRRAAGRLERYGSNPRVEQERVEAQVRVEVAREALDGARHALASSTDTVSGLDAELTVLRSPRPNENESYEV